MLRYAVAQEAQYPTKYWWRLPSFYRAAGSADRRMDRRVPGTYRYFCTHHEVMGMVGTVVVQ